jgi:hypothetical protein
LELDIRISEMAKVHGEKIHHMRSVRSEVFNEDLAGNYPE